MDKPAKRVEIRGRVAEIVLDRRTEATSTIVLDVHEVRRVGLLPLPRRHPEPVGAQVRLMVATSAVPRGLRVGDAASATVFGGTDAWQVVELRATTGTAPGAPRRAPIQRHATDP